MRGLRFAIDHDGCAAFATPDLRETILNFVVGDGVLGSARRAGDLHDRPLGEPDDAMCVESGSGMTRAGAPITTGTSLFGCPSQRAGAHRFIILVE